MILLLSIWGRLVLYSCMFQREMIIYKENIEDKWWSFRMKPSVPYFCSGCSLLRNSKSGYAKGMLPLKALYPLHRSELGLKVPNVFLNDFNDSDYHNTTNFSRGQETLHFTGIEHFHA